MNEICSETCGRRDDPPVLLIMGVMASMLWWPDEFCERLAGAGRFVIRYRIRAVGLPTPHLLRAGSGRLSRRADRRRLRDAADQWRHRD
jgi:pimeloyl-ACP methyl ester carboxylesterase